MCVCVEREREIECLCIERERLCVDIECVSVERDSGSVCRELESACSEREIKRENVYEYNDSVSIERENSVYKERVCVCREKER